MTAKRVVKAVKKLDIRNEGQKQAETQSSVYNKNYYGNLIPVQKDKNEGIWSISE